VIPANGKSTIRFSIFELDLKAGELRRNGSKIRLQEQPFQILVSLLEQPGEVVTRDELRNKLWPADTFVDFDHSLNAAIRRLRDALGDSADTPRFVETVARRGYRFIAPVARAASPTAPPTVEATSPERESWPGTRLKSETTVSAQSRGEWLIGVAVAAAVLIGAVLLIRYFSERPPAPGQISVRRLTANATEVPVISATLSPSGKYLAYADTTGTYLRQLDSGETHSLRLPAGFAPHPVSWLPDDNHLLAVTHPEHGPGASVWRVSVMGGDPVLLTDNGTAPVASPDGTQIAFIRGTRSSQEIWVMRADGENPAMILSCQLCLLGSLAWNPNGKQLAYVKQQYQIGSFFGFETQLEVFSFDSHRSQLLHTHVGTSLAWTRDGRIFYVLAEAPPNQTDANLWAARVDASGTRLEDMPERITNASGLIASVSVSADGKRLAILRRTLQPNVYVATVYAHGTRISTPAVLTPDEWYDFPTAWTPDSKWVLFFSDRDGVFHIFKQAVDQAKPELLVGGNESAVLPRLSSDGSMVLYVKNAVNSVPEPAGPYQQGASGTMYPRIGLRQQIMRVPVNGGPPQFVLEGRGINNLQCARLPSTLCLYSELTVGEEHFYRFDPVKGKGEELRSATIHDSDYYSFNWSLSPDGKLLAFSKKLGIQDRPSIRLFSLDENKEHPIFLPGWTGLATLDWSADGKSLWASAFSSAETASALWSTGVNATTNWTLLNIDLSGKVSPVLEEGKKNLGWAIPSPDGSKIALWEASGGANVWLVERH
jgi:DNA-binding winged helix-turn-helix (wHTH) protein/Tol biopolymer transport system component